MPDDTTNAVIDLMFKDARDPELMPPSQVSALPADDDEALGLLYGHYRRGFSSSEWRMCQEQHGIKEGHASVIAYTIETRNACAEALSGFWTATHNSPEWRNAASMEVLADRADCQRLRRLLAEANATLAEYGLKVVTSDGGKLRDATCGCSDHHDTFYWETTDGNRSHGYACTYCAGITQWG